MEFPRGHIVKSQVLAQSKRKRYSAGHCLSFTEKGLTPKSFLVRGWWAPNGQTHLGPEPSWLPIRAQSDDWPRTLIR